MADRFLVPVSVSAAAKMKDSGSAFLAGGTEINRLGSGVRAGTLISIGRLGLDTINSAEIDGKDYVRIGATATFTECIENPMVPDYFKNACRFMSSMVRRNMATVGGNLALCRDDSYLIPVLVVSNALVEFSKGALVSADRYVRNHEKYEDRLITGIYVDPAVRVNAKKYSNTASGHAYVSVAVSGRNVAVQIKGAGLLDTSALEETEDRSEDFCIRWAKEIKNRKIRTDMYGSEAYKRYLAGVTVSLLSKEGGAQ